MEKQNVAGYLEKGVPLPGLDDPEGSTIPNGIPCVIDAHVHLFPGPVFKAVWDWFENYGWPVRYQGSSSELLEFLFSRGIDHVVAFQYAHKPGIASGLNRYMLEKVKAFDGKITGMATLFPGEENMTAILEEAFDSGLKGLKLHAHVQCFDLASQMLDPVFDLCLARGMPVVIHAGREPKSPAYACDPYDICAVEKVELLIEKFPDLRLCVPHLGMDEFEAYHRLIKTHDNLWLDTAMALTDYMPLDNRVDLADMRLDRIMYGSDFPNIPFAWDRELRWLTAMGLPRDAMEGILWKNAAQFFNIAL